MREHVLHRRGAWVDARREANARAVGHVHGFQAAIHLQVVGAVHPFARDEQQAVQPAVAGAAVADAVGRLAGLLRGDPATFHFKHGEQHARADAQALGDQLHHLGPAEHVAVDALVVVGQQTVIAIDKRGNVKVGVRRAIDRLAVGNEPVAGPIVHRLHGVGRLYYDRRLHRLCRLYRLWLDRRHRRRAARNAQHLPNAQLVGRRQTVGRHQRVHVHAIAVGDGQQCIAVLDDIGRACDRGFGGRGLNGLRDRRRSAGDTQDLADAQVIRAQTVRRHERVHIGSKACGNANERVAVLHYVGLVAGTTAAIRPLSILSMKGGLRGLRGDGEAQRDKQRQTADLQRSNKHEAYPQIWVFRPTSDLKWPTALATARAECVRCFRHLQSSARQRQSGKPCDSVSAQPGAADRNRQTCWSPDVR